MQQQNQMVHHGKIRRISVKKLLAVILVLVLMIPVAMAENIDLSSMSYAELFTLRQQIDDAIKLTPEWEEVTVTDGTWIIGTDIPDGYWTISASVGEQISVSYKKRIYYLSEKKLAFQELESENVSLQLEKGEVIEIKGIVDTSHPSAVFTPYRGNRYIFKPAPDLVEGTYPVFALSYDELVTLQNSVNQAIWNTYEWDCALIDPTELVAGEDISVGKWHITADKSSASVLVKVYSAGNILAIQNNNPDAYKEEETFVAFLSALENSRLSPACDVDLSDGDQLFVDGKVIIEKVR